MGYQTDFNITIFDKDKKILNDKKVEFLTEEIEDKFNIMFSTSNKWYDHIENMTLFSKSYPDYYFYFYNSGEESLDIWWSCFHNGISNTKELNVIEPTLKELGF